MKLTFPLSSGRGRSSGGSATGPYLSGGQSSSSCSEHSCSSTQGAGEAEVEGPKTPEPTGGAVDGDCGLLLNQGRYDLPKPSSDHLILVRDRI